MNIKNKTLMIIADSHSPDARLQKEINSLNSHQYSVDTICWDRENNPLLPSFYEKNSNHIFRYKTISKRGSPFLFLFNIIRFYWYILCTTRKISFDFIHIHSFQVLPIGIILKLFYIKPLIYDVHEVTETYGNNLVNGFGKIIWKLEKLLLRYVNQLIAATEPLAQRYNPYFLYRNEPIFLLNCLPYIKNNFQLNDNRKTEFIIGRIGNLRPKSRIDLITEIINRLSKRGNNIKFIIAGQNIAGYEVESKPRIKSLGKLVEYVPWIPIHEFKNYYGIFDIILNIHEKGDPLEEKYAYFSKVFESISFGVPVVINDFPTMTDFVKENNIGEVVYNLEVDSFVEKIEYLIKNKSALIEKRENCKVVAKEKVNWQIMEMKLIKAYQNLN